MENWSAFAPDFKELDENVDYEERESEFDIEDEDRSPARDNPEDNDENEEVDVISVNPNFNYLSSDEDGCDEDNTLLYLPITLEIDESDNLDNLMDTSINPSSDVENIKDEHIKPIDIELENVPKDGELSGQVEIRPLLKSFLCVFISSEQLPTSNLTNLLQKSTRTYSRLAKDRERTTWPLPIRPANEATLDEQANDSNSSRT